MAEEKYYLRLQGPCYVSGPVESITFATSKDETMFYSREEAEQKAREYRIQERVNVVLERVIEPAG